MAKVGFAALVSFTALLSINLGLVNLFPIPMLDGGHLLFYAAEAIKGKANPGTGAGICVSPGLCFSLWSSWFLLTSMTLCS